MGCRGSCGTFEYRLAEPLIWKLQDLDFTPRRMYNDGALISAGQPLITTPPPHPIPCYRVKAAPHRAWVIHSVYTHHLHNVLSGLPLGELIILR